VRHEAILHQPTQSDHDLHVLSELLASVLTKHRLRNGIQVGFGPGNTAESLLECCSLERLYGVNRYQHPMVPDVANGSSRLECHAIQDSPAARLARFGPRFIMINDSFDLAPKRVPDGMDFVYLDVAGPEQEITSQLRTWFSKVRDGGIIAGRLYGPDRQPVGQKAANTFFSRFGWPICTEEPGLWWTLKQPISISFFIPAFNCSQTLVETVTSITLNNLGSDDEVIIVDDGSTDSTVTCAQKLAAGDGRVRLIQHRHNKGGASARNTAVEAARHSLLFCLDSDNVLEANSIPGLRNCLIDGGADVAAFQELHYFRQAPGMTTHIWRFKPGAVELQDYLAGTIVPGASGNYLFTAQSWTRAGGYPIDAKALDTWGFGLRQVATGSRMITYPATRYFHRYGHDSYWVREAKAGHAGLIALTLIIPYLDRLEKRDVEYLFSKRGRREWFESLDQRPLRVREKQIGRNGCSVMTGDVVEVNRAILRKKLWPSPKRLLQWARLNRL
jgi:glycosyltransferase involved in cell wall biosynthesis